MEGHTSTAGRSNQCQERGAETTTNRRFPTSLARPPMQCIEHFTGVLREHHRVLEKRLATEPAGGSSASASGSMLTSFGWAVSSLGLSRATEAAPAPPPSGSSNGASSAAATGAGTTHGRPAASPGAASLPLTHTQSASNGWDDHQPAISPPAAANTGGGGWDDEDPLEDMLDAVAAGAVCVCACFVAVGGTFVSGNACQHVQCVRAVGDVSTA
jgi:hypothetical protein